MNVHSRPTARHEARSSQAFLPMNERSFTLAVPADFGFDATVRSHGWFDLAPFVYDAARELRFGLEVAPGRAVGVALASADPLAPGAPLRVRVEGAAPRAAVEAAVRAMLQLDRDLTPLHALLARRGE